jgi:uncharacterized caspase-like protein
MLNEQEKLQRTAIAIGISRYEANDRIPALQGAENDAREIYERLTSIGNFTIADDHLLLGKEATQRNISKAISDIFRKDLDSQLIIFYFSGHGIIDEDQQQGYLAPYDIDPEDPFVCGINIEELRNIILNSKTKANVAVILDCCYAGITASASRNVRGTGDEQAKQVYASRVETVVSEDISTGSGRGRIVLASMAADEVSREKFDCVHSKDSIPHAHGAFSFHLIEGLEGKAANPDTGIITFDSIRRYLEAQMKAEGKQTPYYYTQEASQLENIKIAVSQAQYTRNIEAIVNTAKQYAQIPDIQALTIAAKKIGELQRLDVSNENVVSIKNIINEKVQEYRNPILRWLNNIGANPLLRIKIEEIKRGLFDDTFYALYENLSFETLQKINQHDLQCLTILCAESTRSIPYTSDDDPHFKILLSKLRSIYGRTF